MSVELNNVKFCSFLDIYTDAGSVIVSKSSSSVMCEARIMREGDQPPALTFKIFLIFSQTRCILFPE